MTEIDQGAILRTLIEEGDDKPNWTHKCAGNDGRSILAFGRYVSGRGSTSQQSAMKRHAL
jgi:hypothetical protein